MLVDTHAHLYWDSFQDDLEQVIDRCVDNNLGIIINIGTDLKTSQQSIDLTSEQIKMYATVGIHPHDGTADLTQNMDQLMVQLEQMALSAPDKVVAIGECGLDFSQGDQDKQTQQKLYRQQVLLAKKLNLPLVIHCRNAWQDIFIPELQGAKGVFHTFSGTSEDAQKALDLGFYLSFSCTITYPKNEELRQILKELPLDKIVTETDCPFLPPQPIRGERNEPMYVKEVIKVIAELKNLDQTQVEDQVIQNSKLLFGI